MDSMKLLGSWNTGRGYSGKGQRIAVWDAETHLVMTDYDHGITYALNREEFTDRFDLIAYVMFAYDHNKCRNTKAIVVIPGEMPTAFPYAST